jgi:hypothetical protein
MYHGLGSGLPGAPESTGNIGFGLAPYAKLGDVVAFVLRELVASIHVAFFPAGN